MHTVFYFEKSERIRSFGGSKRGRIILKCTIMKWGMKV
jgi:hypothetical protein